MNNINSLIFGKSPINYIVAIEPKDNSVEIFRENPDGSVTSEFFPNTYWILSSKSLEGKWKRLNGDLHYGFIQYYDNKRKFLDCRRHYKGQDTFSIYNSKESLMIKEGYGYFKDMKPSDIGVLAFDIEATTLKHTEDAKLLLISNTFRRCNTITRKLFAYDDYEDEGVMIQDWCSWVRKIDPSILLGHNCFGYDLPYLNYIASKYDISLDIGRDGSSLKINDKYQSDFRVDGNRDLHYHDCYIYGRNIIDTMFLAIKADSVEKKYDSYGLKAIIKQEGWENKDRVFYDASRIRDNYKITQEWDKIKDYCIHDADDSLTLFDKFIPPYFYMAQSIPKSFQATMQSASGSQLNSIMLRSYLQKDHSIPKADIIPEFEGAISWGNPGIFNNILKLDIASLYPSIMMEYKIYPEKKDPDKYFLNLVEYFRTERLKNKGLAQDTGEDYYKHLEQSEKIFINSLYGFMGAPGLAFNYGEGAATVTRYGREILQRGIDWVNSRNMLIANVDTDSISFGHMDGSFIHKEQRILLKDELSGNFPQTIRWDDDGFYPKFIVIKSKNYVLHKENGDIKYKGSALKSPTLEPALREFLEKIVGGIIKETHGYLKIYEDYVKEILDIKDIKRWVKRMTISDKTLTSERTNESKVRDAIEETDYVEGDRIYCYFKTDNSLALIEDFDGDHSKSKFLEKLHKTAQRFSTILDTKIFPNYSLKKHQNQLLKFEMSLYKTKALDFIQKEESSGKSILPGKDKIFKAFEYFNPDKTKVVIIGQDPYPNKKDACGLAFSVSHSKIPASLKNVFKELQADLNINFPSSGDLSPWASQGVLLLNSILTIEEEKSLSHSNIGWEQYTDCVLKKLVNLKKPIVIICWGKYAKDKLTKLAIHDKIMVLTGNHPSPLNQSGGFLGGKYFSKTNDWLAKHKVKPIDWIL